MYFALKWLYRISNVMHNFNVLIINWLTFCMFVVWIGYSLWLVFLSCIASTMFFSLFFALFVCVLFKKQFREGACKNVRVALNTTHHYGWSFQTTYARNTCCSVWGLFIDLGIIRHIWRHAAVFIFILILARFGIGRTDFSSLEISVLWLLDPCVSGQGVLYVYKYPPSPSYQTRKG